MPMYRPRRKSNGRKKRSVAKWPTRKRATYRKRTSTTRGGGSRGGFKRKVQRVVEDLAADNVFLLNGNNIASCAVGQQAMFIGANDTGFSNVGNGIMREPQALVDIFTSAYTAPKNTRLFVKSWHTSFRIKNMTDAEVYLTEYRCMARQDVGKFSLNSGGSLVNETLLDWVQNVSDEQNPPSGPLDTALTTGLVDYGVTPFMNHRFCQNFKILKVKQKMLYGGQVWNVAYGDKKRVIYEYEHLTQGGTLNKLILKGQTFSLFRLQGGQVSGASSGHSSGAVKVGIICNVSGHWGYINDFTASSAASVGIANAVTGAVTCAAANPITITSESIMAT